MATSIRGSASNAKQKRATPSSSAINKNLKPLSSTSSPSDEKTISSTDVRKSVRNYLGPTVSSSLNPIKQSKKTSTEASASASASASKPTYTRLKSFDRPPPTSQVQRVVQSSTTGGAVGSRDIKSQSQRSSSSSNKSTASSSSSTRLALERLYSRTSSLKDEKVDPNLSKSRTPKKCNFSTSTKKATTSNYRKKAPKSMTSKSSVDCENQRPSINHLIHEDDLVNLDAHEVQSLPEISEMPNINEELADPINFEGEEEPKKIILEVVHHNEEETSMVVDQVAEATKLADRQYTQGSGTEEQVDEGAGGRQNEVPEAEPTNTLVEEEKNEEEKEPVEKVDEKVEVEPTEAQYERRTVSSPIVDSSMPKKTAHPNASAIGKKDKHDYNHVIEETTTKLMGGRKNKVLAMAGAFETVISLQDSNKR